MYTKSPCDISLYTGLIYILSSLAVHGDLQLHCGHPPSSLYTSPQRAVSECIVCTGSHLGWQFLSLKCSDNASIEGASMPIQEETKKRPQRWPLVQTICWVFVSSTATAISDGASTAKPEAASRSQESLIWTRPVCVTDRYASTNTTDNSLQDDW